MFCCIENHHSFKRWPMFCYLRWLIVCLDLISGHARWLGVLSSSTHIAEVRRTFLLFFLRLSHVQARHLHRQVLVTIFEIWEFCFVLVVDWQSSATDAWYAVDCLLVAHSWKWGRSFDAGKVKQIVCHIRVGSLLSADWLKWWLRCKLFKRICILIHKVGRRW